MSFKDQNYVELENSSRFEAIKVNILKWERVLLHVSAHKSFMSFCSNSRDRLETRRKPESNRVL